MTGRGRPAIGPVVKVAMPDEQRAEVEAFAQAEGLKLAAAVRVLVERGLATQ